MPCSLTAVSTPRTRSLIHTSVERTTAIRYDQGVGDPFPFRWYGTQYFDSEEVSLRVLFQQDAVRERLAPALSKLPYPALQWCPLPSADVERDPYEEPPEPGVVQAHLSGRWLSLYVNLGDPGDISEDIEGLRSVLRTLHDTTPILEVVEGHGNVFAYPDVGTEDEWTGWSITQRAPTLPPESIRHAFWTPFDERL